MTPTEEMTYREGVKSDLSDIKKMVAYTNGRVRWLEKVIWSFGGGWAVLTIIVIPILIAYIQTGKV